jgi:RNA polymerase sigma-70 factor (ECF subfamily)
VTRATKPIGGSDGEQVLTPIAGSAIASDEHVLAAQRGDEAAFVTLYRHVNPPLQRYLRVLVGTDAEDVAAETWAHVCRDLGGFRGGLDAFRGWVTRIGRNRALDLVRTRQRRPSVAVAPEDLWFLGSPTDVAQQVVDALGTDDALALVASLPREQAEAVMLRVVLDFDARAAGAVVGRSAGAVRTAAYRGLRALAVLLEARASDEDRTAVPRWAAPPEAS